MMNKIQLVGRLTKEVENIEGKKCDLNKFTIAFTTSKKDGDDYCTTFVNCIAFNKTKYLAKATKGQTIVVCGELQTNTYESKSGTKHISYTLVCDDVQL